jgi:O-antigen ligase
MTPPLNADRPKWSALNTLLAVFMFFSPAYPMPAKSVLGFVSPLGVGLLALALLWSLVTGKTAFYSNRYSRSILLLYLLLLLSDAVCMLKFGSAPQAPYLAGRAAMAVIFLAGMALYPDTGTLQRLIRILCWSGFALSVITILQGFGVLTGAFVHAPRLFFGVRLPFYKATGFDMSDGEFGIMAVPVFLYCLLQHYGPSGIPPMKGRTLIALTTGLALLVTQSRSTWLGLALSLTAMTALLPKGRHGRLVVGMAYLLGFTLLFTNVYGIIVEGLVSKGIYSENVYNRFRSYRGSLEFFLDSPLTGVGHGNATHVEKGQQVLIHNQLLDQLASAGLIGFLPLAGLYATFFLFAFKAFRRATDPGTRGLVVWLTLSMLHASVELMLYRGFYSEHLPVYFALLGGVYGSLGESRPVTL